MNKTYKVDFVIGKMDAGGAQRVIANLANYLSNHNYEIRIITFRTGDAYKLESAIERIRFDNLNIYRRVLISCFFSLLKFYSRKSNRPDIISAHIGEMGFSTIPIARLYGIKIIVSEHNNHFIEKQKFNKRVLWKYWFKSANAITVLTKYDLPFFSRFNPKIVVMENPCSFEISQANFQKREPVIIALGDLNRFTQKGFDTLIEIVAEVLPNYPDWKLKIIGEGLKGEKYLKELTNKFQITNQVQFTGYRSDVKAIMAHSEIFILPSRWEGLPMVLLEALSQRMACITFDCKTGPSEIIRDDYNGFLIEDQNKPLMIKKLSELIENKKIRRKFQKNAPDILDNYTIENVGKKWMALFDEITN